MMREVRRTAVLAAALLLAGAADAAEVKVMNSGGFTAAYRDLAPGCEAATRTRVVTAWGASMGSAPDAIPNRLARGEPVDVVIMAAPALDALIRQGKVAEGSRVDLARSSISVAVRAGAPKPDISSVEALARSLQGAQSIAYSASASGTYLSSEVFPRLDPTGGIAAKAKRILSERVGTVVARGDAEIGFQQTSELLPIPGIDIVGPLPPEIQQRTMFSAGIATGAQEPEAARALVRCLSAPAAAEAIARSGLEPATGP